MLAFLASPLAKVAGVAIAILALGGAAWAAIGHFREQGRNEIRAEVAAVVAGQRDRVKDATVKALEKISDARARQIEIATEAIERLKESGSDCAVDPGIADAIRRMRQAADGAGGNTDR